MPITYLLSLLDTLKSDEAHRGEIHIVFQYVVNERVGHLANGLLFFRQILQGLAGLRLAVFHYCIMLTTEMQLI